MKTIINVENIQCSSCVRSIGKEIGIVPGVYGVNVDIANKAIVIDHTEEITEKELQEKFENIY
ncbi:heavy metal-associated domain-containing protein [Dysgonomonas sp. Marseille-Q5470]|uniref:heavy-metal-associated domain-containing protein n=1 Tax=Dysgonomonas sp. Marseille-Q5470 TaxID=3039494 RepID=UPI0024BBF353|nr:heavy metal-associated domain-containing protein [Dysgonomonas sp. Marseille-Q5470]